MFLMSEVSLYARNTSCFVKVVGTTYKLIREGDDLREGGRESRKNDLRKGIRVEGMTYEKVFVKVQEMTYLHTIYIYV